MLMYNLLPDNYLKVFNKKIYKHMYVNNFIHDISIQSFHKILLVKDLSWFYLTRMGAGSKDKRNSNNYLVIDYTNKFVEYIDFRSIFRKNDICQVAPFKSKSHLQPSVSYKYPPTILAKVLNYKQTYGANLNSASLQCKCSTSTFKDNVHNHIISGDLSIINNQKLRNVLMKGLNYRDQAKPCHKSALKSVKIAIKKYCEIYRNCGINQ